jgi:hypothetical protein
VKGFFSKSSRQQVKHVPFRALALVVVGGGVRSKHSGRDSTRMTR